jgi:hypothetical protein
MTSRGAVKLAKRIEFWQKRLPMLAIGHFDIKCVTTTDDVPCRGGLSAVAAVQTSVLYDSCHFYFDNDFVDEADQHELDQTIIHEWVHVAMRDFDVSLHAVESWMPEQTYEDFKETVDQRREGFVDRVARQLYDAYKE